MHIFLFMQFEASRLGNFFEKIIAGGETHRKQNPLQVRPS